MILKVRFTSARVVMWLKYRVILFFHAPHNSRGTVSFQDLYLGFYRLFITCTVHFPFGKQFFELNSRQEVVNLPRRTIFICLRSTEHVQVTGKKWVDKRIECNIHSQCLHVHDQNLYTKALKLLKV